MGILWKTVVMIAIIYLLNSLFVLLQQRIMVTISQQVIRKLRQDLFTHFQELPLIFFDTHPHGELMRQFSRPLNHIAQLFNSVQSALAGAERVFEIMDMQSEFKQNKTRAAPVLCNGKVEFKDVYFSYRAGIQVLKGINIKVDAGKTIALVGPTGAGKTTIVNLLTRFYPVDSGSIQIDGMDLEKYGKKELRRNLGIVLQDTFLFSATVMENIRYGRIDAPDKEVYQAAEMAYADFFIRHMPEGYQTMITENGSNLSQGQRQLLAISRAILSDPAILILDEATSSIDTRTEVHIQKAMLNLMHGRTSFVIAHRLNTIRGADCILVIHNGRIIEQGTHNRLMAARGFYHNLYTRQFQGELHL